MFADYIRHGWSLCAIEKGSKSPRYAQWPTNPIPLEAADGIDGAGLLHALSGTASLDVDDATLARPWLAERGVDLDALLADDYAVQISSGRANRAKLLFKMSRPMRTVRPANSGLELRSASANGSSVQCVLPPSIHPTTGKPYEWRLGLLADWRAPPALPAPLLSAWRGEAEPIYTEAKAESVAPAGGADIERLRTLLKDRDPDASYPDWIKAMMAVHSATGGSAAGLAVVDEWSQKGVKYRGLADLRTHWASFKSSPGKRVVTIASLGGGETPAAPDEFPVAEPEAELLPEKPKRNPRIASALGMQTQGANGEMLSNLHNAERMLRNAHGESLTLEYDEFTSRVLVQWPDTPRRDWTDTDAGRLQLMLQTKGLRTASKETAYTVADLVAKEHTVNAVRDMLERLVWDGTPRLTTWLSHAFGAPTTRYYLRAGRNWLISMVARAYQPGCQVDTMTVLEGPQGNAKSSAFRILAAPWFAELIADFESKDATQQLRGLWLAEFGELHKLNKGSVELAKQYITNRDDRYRPTYGRIEVSHPRQCVLVGTTNQNDWARDETATGDSFQWNAVPISILSGSRPIEISYSLRLYTIIRLPDDGGFGPDAKL